MFCDEENSLVDAKCNKPILYFLKYFILQGNITCKEYITICKLYIFSRNINLQWNINVCIFEWSLTFVASVYVNKIIYIITQVAVGFV